MRAILIVLALLPVLGSFPAWAAWVKVGEADGAVLYLDMESMKKNGKLRRITALQDLKARDRDGELSARIVYEVDCRDESFRYFRTKDGRPDGDRRSSSRQRQTQRLALRHDRHHR